ncbi:LIM homeobox transcription factor 1-beta-like isoform X1 [Brevipalpus obovatus]|uniref:LIM homeobox transcription factor 1-beta-like isoform X1 n=1 Tax=Brevipalpus obovatus TaxID=246614 RepID=UPI003D9F5C19
MRSNQEELISSTLTSSSSTISLMEAHRHMMNENFINSNGLSRKSMGKKITDSVKSELNGESVEICSGCRRPIEDRYIMRVMDHSWHERCLTCTECDMMLTQTCYSRDCKLYCKSDYEKLYGAKCTGCCEIIPSTEMVMRALDSIFHLNCFTCVGCGKQLKKGDQFVMRSGRLFCRPDFEKELALLQIPSQPSENTIIPSANNQNSPVPPNNHHNGLPGGNSVNQNGIGSSQRQDGRRGPKRPRTILTTAQRRAFKNSFDVSQKPCRKVREALAKETGLSVRIVQVWFQNQRAKLKKIQRKQQQQMQQQSMQHSNNSDSNGGQSGDKSTMDKLSPYSSRMGQNGNGHLSDSSADSPSFSMAPIQYLAHSPDGSYYSTHGDGYSKGDLGMDSETSLGGLEDVLHQSGTSNGDESSGIHQTMDHPNHPSNISSIFTTSMTPIDKLYSMHTSYFSSNECECLGTSN